jgi:hypothetical protein
LNVYLHTADNMTPPINVTMENFALVARKLTRQLDAEFNSMNEKQSDHLSDNDSSFELA